MKRSITRHSHRASQKLWGHALACLAFAAVLLQTQASDWPSYRADLSRSAQVEIQLPEKLVPSWIYHSNHRPIPAWPLPGEETPRMHTDRAFHAVVAHQTAYFGSSVDHQIRALDTRTGELKWRFYANAAIRFAPQIAEGNLYFGADDGYIYSLDAHSGKLNWRHRPSPADERIIGRGNMIGTWPIRTGLVVSDNIVYAAAGIFPYEGLYITAINAEDGSEIWTNDTAGDLSWGLDYGGMAPQGYLLLSEKTLYVPSGRGMPAAFDRATGEFRKFLSPGGKTGGSWALIDQGNLVAGVNSQGDPAKIVYDEDGNRKGDLFANFNGIDVVLTPTVAYTLTVDGVVAVDRAANELAGTELPKIDKEISERSKRITAIREEIKKLPADLDAEARATRTRLRKELTEATRLIASLNDRKDQLNAACTLWQYPILGLSTLARGGNSILCGGDDFLLSLEAQTGKLQWKEETDDKVLGLTIADSRVLASTVAGTIYCFAKPGGLLTHQREPISGQVFAEMPNQKSYAKAANQILSLAGVAKGFCLVIDTETGQLAYEIAQQSDLKLVLPIHDSQRLRQVRARLQSTGLYGQQIIAVPWDYEELPDYFANLVVSERLIRQPGIAAPLSEIGRVIRPAGGTAILGSPKITGSLAAIQRWASTEPFYPSSTHTENGEWIQFTRPKLDGAGTWNGLYGDVGNSGSSPDELVKGPLGVLWFGEPGSEFMLDRHARSVSPLAVNGRLFVQGMEVVMAYDAYNGTFLWQHEIEGAVRSRVDVDGSNLFATEKALFVAAEDRTYQFDAQTGEVIREFSTPERNDSAVRRWGYISVDNGILYGSGAIPLKHEYGAMWNAMVSNGKWKAFKDVDPYFTQIKARRTGRDESIVEYFFRTYDAPTKLAYDYFKRAGLHWRFQESYPGWLPDHEPSPTDERMMISDSLFAYDVASGELLWHRQGHHIPQISLTLGEGRFYFVDGNLSESEKAQASAERERQIGEGTYLPHDESNLAYDDRDFRRVVAVNARTGETEWTKAMDLSGAGGNKLGAAFKDGRLLFFGHYSNHDQTPFAEGKLSWRRITVLNANSGDLYWSKPLNYRRRPLIVNDTLFVEPRAASLTTGEIKMRQHPITGEEVEWEFLRPGHSCGVVTATPNNLFFRSYSAAIVNLEQDSGLQLFGGTRPGCWNSMIPANGLLTMQEASAGCTCSYSLRTTVTMKTKRQKGPGEWAVFISQTPTVPVSHMALNLGAPGDLRDPDGTMWFAYPRPDTSDGQGPFKNYGVKFDLHENEGIHVNRRDYRGVRIQGSDQPWLYTSSILGLQKLEIPLLDGEESGVYQVRIGFSAHPGQEKGQRVFNVRVQGETLLHQFDVLSVANGPREAVVKEFSNIAVDNNLLVEFQPHSPQSRIDRAPMVQFIEITRQDKTPKKVGLLNPVN